MIWTNVEKKSLHRTGPCPNAEWYGGAPRSAFYETNGLFFLSVFRLFHLCVVPPVRIAIAPYSLVCPPRGFIHLSKVFSNRSDRKSFSEGGRGTPLVRCICACKLFKKFPRKPSETYLGREMSFSCQSPILYGLTLTSGNLPQPLLNLRSAISAKHIPYQRAKSARGEYWEKVGGWRGGRRPTGEPPFRTSVAVNKKASACRLPILFFYNHLSDVRTDSHGINI